MDDRETLMMTPGPTALPEEVREAMARPIQNPDIEPAFSEFYGDFLGKLARVYGTDDDLVVLAGEGMVGLEASVASLIEPGDTVLCLANGIYGAGFGDLVSLHGGEPVLHEVSPTEGFDPEAVREAVEEHEPDVATMVHCETPTGVLNDFDGVLDVFDEAGVLTICDAVSSLGGVEVPTESIDICLGASQKCFSAPPGLATLSVSEAAWERIEAIEQRSFYLNLEPWRDLGFEDPPAAFPYTHSVSDLYALDAALDRLLDEGIGTVFERHARAAAHCRERGRDLGLEPFASEHSSPTVTAFAVENADTLRERVATEGVVLATGLGEFSESVLRVGHMGYNAEIGRVDRAMDALEAVLD
ncbi:pyridoxal-phosphate-dependent aminotransferase family protein [Halalkalicoccus jeotgali]|uniref:Aminotransferase class V n=1 Tax=Halalkalicoccus jeotgali (strain DSM 18796 / CECT 7217 / JCM 14584 / KCTC 4019 / B3) TaxID=795797 RepID=D8JAA5_HALJB|nr:alanine--glyoxylate aminotransferase family protein [Halalkalicoccus jeotgali]ADJ14627.1 aminotransferase class V [Halalkalicoccus jeotgali B3]ELY39526.1 class V aminotransferase [Halalkalicoccus jeotgali B3]